MKIAYMPIDERPCNVDYVKRIAQSSAEIDLLMPCEHVYGRKKEPADSEGMWEWLKGAANEADALIISIDMLFYGGLLPSRLHHHQENIKEMWLNRLRSLRQSHPKLPIYASNLIMRTPKYSSNDEEPDYYEKWGRELFLRAYLMNKQDRETLSEEELEQLRVLKVLLPAEHIEDYEWRRAFNLEINVKILELVKEAVIDFLVIPQDDSAEFGYTAQDQKIVATAKEEMRLHQQVHMYPGADEVGATLLSRAFSSLTDSRPSIFPIWSSTLGPGIIPMYEDRPFAESLKAHVMASGCKLAQTPEKADLILAYNTPGRMMQESWDQHNKDITYTSCRSLLHFIDSIQTFLAAGKKVILADAAFTNGGDMELVAMLDDARLLDKLTSYKGWNTNCNTLGTSIAQGVVALNGDPDKVKENLVYHLLDDVFYQACVRMELVKDFLPTYKLSYFDLKDQTHTVTNEIRTRLLKAYDETIRHSFTDMQIDSLLITSPWNRMFECKVSLKLIRKRGENHVKQH
ncbi:DUF4127 family protein [Jeotgalibacillus campisalis]|uniref:DUF4127 domain-containing protein n=1 Tax=Jeotgalibacillus campisalis TaxID=220754 RepID=A0A0C2QYG7_9BACL|nr:DUF4127 family protein [Jeotgalibacillus campisalis]KIL43065.1 hypothetical protein KR50_34680 [Jeotgalibacillus campisalis]